MDSAVLTLVELGDDVSDVYAWVDANTRGDAVESNNSGGVSERLLPQLHVLSQELSATLQHQLESFPSFDTHVQLLAIKTEGLRLNLQSVTTFPDSVADLPDGSDATTARAVATSPSLILLHEAKQRMQACIHALEESAAWTQHSRVVGQLVSESVSSIAPTSLPSLATHLTAMHKSLRILAPMPGAPERQATMARLLGDIERLVLPALLDQLNRPSTVDVERVAEILTIFKCLDRADVVSGQYAAVRPAAIHRLWLSLETGPRPLNLSDFYADVAAFLGREWLTIGLVFGHETGPSVWLSLLQATLQPCALSSCINVHNVCAWFDQSCRFAQSLLTNYGDVAENHSPVLAPAIVQVIFEPYWPLFESFATVERSEVLALQVRELVVPKSGPVDADFAALVEEAFTGLWEALEVRVQFGLSFALGALLPAVVAAITDTVTEFELALVHQVKLDLDKTTSNSSTSITDPSLMDWERFHDALNLVKTTGLVLTQAEAMQSRWGPRVQTCLNAWILEDSDSVPPFSVDDCRNVATLPKAVMMQWWRSNASKYHDMATLAHSLTYKPLFGHLLEHWTKVVQQLLYASVMTPIQALLRPLPTLEIWIQPEATDALPSFSMLPQDYVTGVADILLSLLPQLELFAETSGLPNAVAASHHVELLSNDAWTAVATTFFPNTPVNDDWMSQSATSSFVDRWTVVMASGAMAVLTGQILQIPRFSATGAAQLACDMGYFENVLMALGVPLHPILAHIRHRLTNQNAPCDTAIATSLDKYLTVTR
ncbi:hypothetical protein, variant [Aphanomyces astaci]|uniref:Conserved oligomeric Golgi complex subunit 7 n=1 Tax=Aphanomyces astaci TaxID=112090 RepID=W4FXP7_APHAT|nr:hypothetical protein, variant [Aphanomyces astaci]ETV71448.1 hypothetical protein, variant [Aphanomyces astaci]|eukprot:XP_009839112.1 hypothetical protein, variant [Aphanomyces astaci]